MSLFSFRRPLRRGRYFIFSNLSFLIVIVFWSILSYGGIIDPFFLPSPSTVLKTIYELAISHNLWTDIGASIFRVLVAFIISAILAIPLGILMSSFKVIEALAEPHIDFIRYLPVPALVPLTILWIGIGEGSKILLLFIGTFFQLVLLVMDDANNVHEEYFELAYTLGADTKDVIRRVLIPAISPSVYDDLRITLGWCWTYLLIGEIVAARTGLGHLIQEAQRFAKPQVVMAGVLIIGVIGLISDYAFKIGYRFFFPYKVKVHVT
jgi:NitT/TauT family transport system permease protein